MPADKNDPGKADDKRQLNRNNEQRRKKDRHSVSDVQLPLRNVVQGNGVETRGKTASHERSSLPCRVMWWP